MPTVPPQGSGGNVGEPIPGYQFRQSATGVGLSITFSPTIDMTTISGIKVKITTSSSTATAYFLRINGLSTAIYDYNGVGVNNVPTVVGEAAVGTTDGILLIPLSSVGNNEAVQMNFELTKEPLGSNFAQLVCQSDSFNSGAYSGGGFASTNISTLTSLELNLPTGGTIDSDSLIEVWVISNTT